MPAARQTAWYCAAIAETGDTTDMADSPTARGDDAVPLAAGVQLGRSGIALQIAKILRSQIVDGAIPLGTRLPSERTLAGQFAVSQPTVREAIRALSAQGLVDVRHGSGVYVRASMAGLLTDPLTTFVRAEGISILEVLDARVLIGRHSGARVARFGGDGDVAALRAALDRVEDADSPAEAIWSLISFQETFMAIARQPLLAALDSFLVRVIMAYQWAAYRDEPAGFWTDWAHRLQTVRRELVDRVEAHDEPGADDVVDDYLARQRGHFAGDPRLVELRLDQDDWDVFLHG